MLFFFRRWHTGAADFANLLFPPSQAPAESSHQCPSSAAARCTRRSIHIARQPLRQPLPCPTRVWPSTSEEASFDGSVEKSATSDVVADDRHSPHGCFHPLWGSSKARKVPSAWPFASLRALNLAGLSHYQWEAGPAFHHSILPLPNQVTELPVKVLLWNATSKSFWRDQPVERFTAKHAKPLPKAKDLVLAKPPRGHNLLLPPKVIFWMPPPSVDLIRRSQI